MDYNKETKYIEPISKKGDQNDGTQNQYNLQEVEFIEGSGVHLTNSDNYEAVTTANDLLQNGILVETNKG